MGNENRERIKKYTHITHAYLQYNYYNLIFRAFLWKETEIETEKDEDRE